MLQRNDTGSPLEFTTLTPAVLVLPGGTIDFPTALPGWTVIGGPTPATPPAVTAAATLRPSEAPTGKISEDWLGSDGAAWPAVWTTSAVTADIRADGSRTAGRLVTDVTANSVASAVQPGVVDGEMLVRWQFTANIAQRSVYFDARRDDVAGNAYSLVVSGTGAVLQATISGTTTALTTTAANYLIGTWYWSRLRWVGSSLYARVWQDGTTEPTGWITATNSGITAAGNIGLRVALGSAAGAAQTGLFSELHVWDTSNYLPTAGGTLTGELYAATGFRLPLVAPSYRRPRWRDASYFRENFQSGHGWTANGSGLASSNLNDTSTFVRGAQSASITSAGAASSVANLRKTNIAGLSSINMADKMFRVLVRVEANAAHLANLNFFIGTSGFTNYYKFVINPISASDAYFSQGDWVLATFGWNDLNSAAGTLTATNGIPATLTGFTDMQLQVADDGTGNGVQLRVQSVEIVDSTTTTFPKGVVSITFDDSWAQQWTNARPIMDTFGYRGTAYTIVETVGTGGYMTLAQLQQLRDYDGWDIAGHAYLAATHNTRLPNLTAAQVDTDLGNLKAWLLQHGFDGDSFAYPGGEMRSTTDGVSVEAIAARYFSSARTILGQANKSIESYPPSMPRRMRACSAISSLNTVNGWTNPTGIAGTGGVLDRIAANGGWWIATFHKIVTGTPADTTECSTTDFQSILSGISSRGITCLPVTDVLRLYA